MRRKVLAALAGAAVVAAAVSAIGWAHNGDTEKIHACVNKAGDVRIVAAGDACKDNESALDWNSQGVAGPAGPQGPKGDPGASAAAPTLTPVGYAAVSGTKQGTFKSTAGNPANRSGSAVVGYTYKLTSPRDAASGQASGKRAHHPVTIVKPVDAASPQYFQALATNETLPQVEIKFYDAAGAHEYTVKLVNASVTELAQAREAKPGEPLLETVSFTFQRIEITSVTGATMAVDDWEQKS